MMIRSRSSRLIHNAVCTCLMKFRPMKGWEAKGWDVLQGNRMI